MKDRNGSGYFDPTADAAIYKADRNTRRVVRVWRAPEDKPEESDEVKSMMEYFETFEEREKKYVEVYEILRNIGNEPYKGVIRRILLSAPAADVVPAESVKEYK